MDEAPTRRGVETVNAKWGNLQAILAGDFLLARASEIAASLGTEVAGLLAHTIGRLCEGQIEELRHTYNAARPESSYLASIAGKTALAVRHVGAHRRHRRRPRPADDRGAHRLRRGVRHGVPDRRRPARHHLHRRSAGQAGRPRHGRGRVHPAGAAHAAERRHRRGVAARPARPAARAAASARRRSRSSAPTAASNRRWAPRASGPTAPSRRARRCRRLPPPMRCAPVPPRCCRRSPSDGRPARRGRATDPGAGPTSRCCPPTTTPRRPVARWWPGSAPRDRRVRTSPVGLRPMPAGA